MLKKLFIFLFLILTTVYLVVAVTVLNGKPSDTVCSGMELIIKDSIDYGFISKRELLRLLSNKKLSPIGRPMGDINTRQLENELRQHPLIGNAGVSAVPDAARVSQNVGREFDKNNHLLMHAMAPNVAGVIGSAVAAGILLSFLG